MTHFGTSDSSLRPATGGSAVIDPGLLPAAVESEDDAEQVVRARSYWELAWRRFWRDKLAVAGGLFFISLFFIAFLGAPLAAKWLGHGPNQPFFIGGLDSSQLPVGPWAHVAAIGVNGASSQQLFILGADSTLPRDEFLRILYGAQVSLEVAVGATLFSMVLGLVLGATAGFYRGWIDTVISRMVEVTMAFPYLLFVIALAGTLGTRLATVTLGFLAQGVLTLVVVFGFLGWFYSARIFRGLTLSLREKEFVEAARMIGASNMRIIRSHILPHLVGPLIVLSTLNLAAFILAEAGLSFLGLGIPLPTASWGNLLSEAPQYYTTRPLLMVWPGVALVLTTLAVNLLGDGLRDALDPRSSR